MTNLKIISIVFAATLFLAVVVAAGQAGQGENAPAWELKNVDGQTVRSSDFKGKVVVLDFWATWCGPCRAEIPGLIALQKQYSKQGLVVIGVSVDEAGAGVVKSFAQKLGMDYPVLLGDEKIEAAFGGIDAIPATFIIDRQGRVVKTHVGLTDQDEFEKEIKPLCLMNP